MEPEAEGKAGAAARSSSTRKSRTQASARASAEAAPAATLRTWLHEQGVTALGGVSLSRKKHRKGELVDAVVQRLLADVTLESPRARPADADTAHAEASAEYRAARGAARRLPLTPEEEEVYNEAMDFPDKQKPATPVQEGTGIALTFKDLLHLAPGGWLNDSIINFALRMSVVRAHTARTSTRQTHAHRHTQAHSTKTHELPNRCRSEADAEVAVECCAYQARHWPRHKRSSSSTNT